MLYSITYLLFKLNIVEPSEKTMGFWMHTNDVSKLEYALKHGNYKTRQLAAEALAYTGQCTSVPVLLQAMDDKVHNVSIAVLNTLEALGCSDDLMTLITRKRFNWVKQVRDKKAKQRASAGKKYKIYRWERASKKSFERVKEQLKRPIR
ncbi:hypothetical protein MHTCC0001_07100 [Flavobacteriaceae bacterium MHTCC 0001]